MPPTRRNAIIGGMLRIGYYAAKLLGVICFTFQSDIAPLHKRYNKRWQQWGVARKSCLWRSYCVLMALGTLALLPFAKRAICAENKFLQQNELINFVGCYRYVILQLCTVFTIFAQVLRQCEMTACVNRLLRYSHKLRDLNASAMQLDLRTLWLMLSKIASLICMSVFTVFEMVHDKDARRASYIAMLIFFYYCKLVLQLTLLMYFVGVLLVTHFARQINRELRRVLCDTQALLNFGTGGSSLKFLQCRWIAFELQLLLRFHVRIFRLSRALNGLYGVQLLSFLTYVLIECVVMLFFQYFVPAHSSPHLNQQQQSDGERSPAPAINYYAVTYVFALLWDVYTPIAVTHQMHSHLMATRCVLAEGSLLTREIDLDERLNVNLAYFALYLRKEQISYTVCGLFPLDNRLLFMIFEMVILYLLILIQFDTILNK